MEDDDPVVQEIDVNLSDIEPLLLLFQYPLRTIDRPYGDEGELKKVTVKSLNNKISMTYGLNTEVSNYDVNASNHRIVNHKLSSTHIPTQTSYCVGTFKDNQFYLSPIDSIYQMRPDFDHVNKESIERLVGGAELELQKQKKAKELVRMQIVEDSQKEQRRKEIELELEEEQELKFFKHDSLQAKEVMESMTSIPEPDQEQSAFLVNICSKNYLPQILQSNKNDDYQSEITNKREGELTMDKLMKCSLAQFIETILYKCGVIGIERLKNLIQSYCTQNKVSFAGKSSDELTNQDIAREIYTLAFVFRSGFCVLKSHHKYESSHMIFLRNKILFELLDSNIQLEYPSLKASDFHKYAEPAQIRQVLLELCENRGGRWFIKFHDRDTLVDAYSQFDDEALVNEIKLDIETQKQQTEQYFARNVMQ